MTTAMSTFKVSTLNSTQPRILLIAMILSACLLQPTASSSSSSSDGLWNQFKTWVTGNTPDGGHGTERRPSLDEDDKRSDWEKKHGPPIPGRDGPDCVSSEKSGEDWQYFDPNGTLNNPKPTYRRRLGFGDWISEKYNWIKEKVTKKVDGGTHTALPAHLADPRPDGPVNPEEPRATGRAAPYVPPQCSECKGKCPACGSQCDPEEYPRPCACLDYPNLCPPCEGTGRADSWEVTEYLAKTKSKTSSHHGGNNPPDGGPESIPKFEQEVLKETATVRTPFKASDFLDGRRRLPNHARVMERLARMTADDSDTV